MASIATIFRRFSRTRSETVCECRRCGTTVETGDEECPVCDSVEIATYQITH